MNTINKGFLINSKEKTITEVEIPVENGSSYNFLSKEAAIFSGLITFAAAEYKDNLENTLYVDDEGLLYAKLDEINYGFEWLGNTKQNLLIGNGVIEGTNEEGEPISSNLTLLEVQLLVNFKEFTYDEIQERLNKGFQVVSFNNYNDLINIINNNE